MSAIGRKGIFADDTGGSASIDIDINGTPFLAGVTTNQDIPVENSATDPVGSDDSGTWRIADSAIENSDASYTNSLPAEDPLTLPDITVTAPNGGTSSYPSVKNYACTAINALANSDLISQLTDAQVAAVFAGRVNVNIVEYTAGATYTTPSNLLFARVVCVGGGSGGGSGKRGASGTNRGGGCGGAAGALTSRFMLASTIGASQVITIGTGGTGGTAQTADDTNGNGGNAGGDTSFGSLVVAKGGQASNGGAAGGLGGASGGDPLSCTPNVFPLSTEGAGGGSGRHATTASNDAPSVGFKEFAGCGGGGGGGMNTSNTEIRGGNGGQAYDYSGSLNTAAAGGVVTGGNGTAGSDNWSLQIIGEYPVIPSNTKGMGTGGGGGGGNQTGAGGAGGAAGSYGAGGGGGGGSINGSNSGKGGDGAGGLCIIVEYLC